MIRYAVSVHDKDNWYREIEGCLQYLNGWSLDGKPFWRGSTYRTMDRLFSLCKNQYREVPNVQFDKLLLAEELLK